MPEALTRRWPKRHDVERLTRGRGFVCGGVHLHLLGGAMRIEKISAVTIRVSDMRRSVRFYGDVLGMEIVYGGEDASFSSLRG